MWAISAGVILGVLVVMDNVQYLTAMSQIKTMPASHKVIRIEGTHEGLQLCFRGPRHVGDFVTQWCSREISPHDPTLRLLQPWHRKRFQIVIALRMVCEIWLVWLGGWGFGGEWVAARRSTPPSGVAPRRHARPCIRWDSKCALGATVGGRKDRVCSSGSSYGSSYAGVRDDRQQVSSSTSGVSRWYEGWLRIRWLCTK